MCLPMLFSLAEWVMVMELVCSFYRLFYLQILQMGSCLSMSKG